MSVFKGMQGVNGEEKDQYIALSVQSDVSYFFELGYMKVLLLCSLTKVL